jgi:hypothetical protein
MILNKQDRKELMRNLKRVTRQKKKIKHSNTYVMKGGILVLTLTNVNTCTKFKNKEIQDSC